MFTQPTSTTNLPCNNQFTCPTLRYNAAKLSLDNRSAQVAMVKESLERDMELLCVTGVEDKLQGGEHICDVCKRGHTYRVTHLEGNNLLLTRD